MDGDEVRRRVDAIVSRLSDKEWNALEANPGLNPGPSDEDEAHA
jgi:hypothetical protein